LQDRQLIANRLKFISEETSIPIVLVGMPWATTIADEPQWASRLLCRRVIPYFKLTDGVEVFVRFLMGLALKMPFKVTPKLEDKHTTLALFSASSGEIRKLKHILNEAVKSALIVGAVSLEKKYMAEVVTMLFPDKPNPFLQRFSEIECCEVQSYSRYDPHALSQDEKLIATRFTKNMSLTQLLKK
jgi:hypothetical protein